MRIDRFRAFYEIIQPTNSIHVNFQQYNIHSNFKFGDKFHNQKSPLAIRSLNQKNLAFGQQGMCFHSLNGRVHRRNQYQYILSHLARCFSNLSTDKSFRFMLTIQKDSRVLLMLTDYLILIARNPSLILFHVNKIAIISRGVY